MSARASVLILAGASSVRVTRVGELDSRKRSRSRSLAVVTDARAIASLRAALEIVEASLDEQVALMTPGTLELHFFEGHTLLDSVTFIEGGWLRYPPWKFNARLCDPTRIVRWLEEHAPASAAKLHRP